MCLKNLNIYTLKKKKGKKAIKVAFTVIEIRKNKNFSS